MTTSSIFRNNARLYPTHLAKVLGNILQVYSAAIGGSYELKKNIILFFNYASAVHRKASLNFMLDETQARLGLASILHVRSWETKKPSW